jgi:hypothetical protein
MLRWILLQTMTNPYGQFHMPQEEFVAFSYNFITFLKAVSEFRELLHYLSFLSSQRPCKARSGDQSDQSRNPYNGN